MKRYSRSNHSRGGSSSSSSGNVIRLSSTRPDSIPTSVLHRSDIDYSRLQTHLALQDHEMRSVRLVLENIIELNPDFSGLNLRLTSERELLCRIANQHMGLFNASITRKLIDRDRETEAVGWLLYQFVLWCLKENGRASRSGSTRGRSNSLSTSGHSTASNSDSEAARTQGMEYFDDHSIDELFADGDESADADDEDGIQSVDDEFEDEFEREFEGVSGEGIEERQQLQGEGFELDDQIPQHMVDSSDLERELEDYEQNIEPQMILRYGSPEVQQQYLRRQGNGHGGIAIPDLSSESSDEEESPDKPKTQPASRGVFLFSCCFLVFLLTIVTIASVQYIHQEQGNTRLWDALVLNRRQIIATATDVTMKSNGEQTASLILTRATARIVTRVEL
ncbi:hypothetical protein TWF718_005743 [Orbilia javanica]|uniref:Uncharacterized protein n=1 Tax=Orbilia javanica TaxID=47235 RepID=A0AAN8N427_9PEZI